MGVRTASCRRRGRQGGFTYIALLVAVSVLGITLAAAGETWRIAAKREREAELLFVGGEYRRAIASYASFTPAGQPRYPRALEDLVEDRRFPVLRRHLRRVYADPVTGKAEWGLVTAPGGGIAGVYSLSEEPPLKSGGFSPDDAEFAKAQQYADWKFVFVPRNEAAALRRAAPAR